MGQSAMVTTAVQTINGRAVITPVQPQVTTIAKHADIVILPIQNGGRGPIINEGEVVSVELLLTLLEDILSENQMTPALRARLDGFEDLIDALDQRITALETP